MPRFRCLCRLSSPARPRQWSACDSSSRTAVTAGCSRRRSRLSSSERAPCCTGPRNSSASSSRPVDPQQAECGKHLPARFPHPLLHRQQVDVQGILAPEAAEGRRQGWPMGSGVPIGRSGPADYSRLGQGHRPRAFNSPPASERASPSPASKSSTGVSSGNRASPRNRSTSFSRVSARSGPSLR